MSQAREVATRGPPMAVARLWVVRPPCKSLLQDVLWLPGQWRISCLFYWYLASPFRIALFPNTGPHQSIFGGPVLSAHFSFPLFAHGVCGFGDDMPALQVAGADALSAGPLTGCGTAARFDPGREFMRFVNPARLRAIYGVTVSSHLQSVADGGELLCGFHG
jgi:hypothetical protein